MASVEVSLPVVVEHAQAIGVDVVTAGEIMGGLSADTVRQLIAHAELPCVRIGRRQVIPYAAAQRWLEDRIGQTVPTRPVS